MSIWSGETIIWIYDGFLFFATAHPLIHSFTFIQFGERYYCDTYTARARIFALIQKYSVIEVNWSSIDSQFLWDTI